MRNHTFVDHKLLVNVYVKETDLKSSLHKRYTYLLLDFEANVLFECVYQDLLFDELCSYIWYRNVLVAVDTLNVSDFPMI